MISSDYAQRFLSRRLLWRICGLGLLLVLLGGIATLQWGGHLLVASEPLPQHAQVLVVLAGSMEADEARRREAIRLLREGRADYVILTAPAFTYLGEWIPDMMRRYLSQTYTEEETRRMILCPLKAASTRDEARALRRCLEERGWRSVVVVTSNYHTRRAGIIWREVLEDADPPYTIYIHGISEADFHLEGWWRVRRSAKTFFLETIRLLWTCLFE